MELDPLVLSRLQFAFVVSFHAIFPVFSIGLAAYIAVLETIRYRTGDPHWQRLSEFWIKVFAVVFGMGVVSGLVMAFQFGTNWSEFAYRTANFIGPTLAYEVVTAFFLEAAFLGVLLFGRHKVAPGLFLFAAWMVAIGTMISSFWILATNSWMHTPAGFELRDGIVHVTSWIEAIFNPSFPYRLGHMLIASLLTGGFVVAGVSAWFLLRGHAVEASRRALKMTIVMLAIAAPAQLVMGDLHGLNTFEHQPAKVAAMEGVWHTERGVPLLLFAIPNAAQETNHLELGIPKLASLILTHSLDGEIRGLTEFAADERPQQVFTIFWAFRVMVGIGMVMIGMALAGAWLLWRGRLHTSQRYLRLLTFMIPLPFVAVLSGWIVTEVGRQPWMLWEVISVSDGLTPSLTGAMALATLIGYVLVYAVIFAAGLTYLTHIVRSGMPELKPDDGAPRGHAKRPLSAVDTPLEGHNPIDDAAHPALTRSPT